MVRGFVVGHNLQVRTPHTVWFRIFYVSGKMRLISLRETGKATMSEASMLEFLFHRVRGRASGFCYEEWPAKHCLEAWMRPVDLCPTGVTFCLSKHLFLRPVQLPAPASAPATGYKGREKGRCGQLNFLLLGDLPQAWKDMATTNSIPFPGLWQLAIGT